MRGAVARPDKSGYAKKVIDYPASKDAESRQKDKQEKGGGVAVHPSAGSQRPATPVVSRDSGILSAKSR